MKSNCYECQYCKVIRGAVRGYMDCDPDEYYCSMNREYFEGEREYDEETGEELPCEYYTFYS